MDEATGNRQQATGDEAVGAVIGRPPEAEAPDEATGNRQQATGDEAVGAVIGRPPEAEAPDEATGNRQQATGDEAVGAVIGRPPEEPACRGGSYPEGEPPARSDEATGNRQQATGDDAIQSLPLEGKVAAPEALTDEVASDEADAPEIAEKAQKRVARLEGLRRWMLVLAPLLLIGGYVTDILPILYASAIPLAIALLATYLIKWTEEKAGKEEVKSKK